MKQNTAPQSRPGPSKAEMRKQIEAAMAHTASLPIKRASPRKRLKSRTRNAVIVK